MTAAMAAELERLSGAGYRTLAVASGPPGEMVFIGLIALNDPPRPDSAGPTGEAAIAGRAHGHGHRRRRADAQYRSPVPSAWTVRYVRPVRFPSASALDDFAVYAGVFPEEKFRLVKAFQRDGHAVGMCGDGANDAPALRQAQMGIAVSTATDVAKAAAGVVLTEPGLEGILTAIQEGRAVFQRVVTYTLGILVNKCVTLVVLGAGLVLTGHAVLTPLLQAISMLTNDFVSMARTADRATPSTRPNTWRVNNLALAAIPLASFKFLFCTSVLAAGWFLLGLTVGQMQTLTFVMLVFAGQAVVYVLRERGPMWRSRPVMPMILFSLVDITIVSTLAIGGILMPSLPATVIIVLSIAIAAFALALDQSR